MRSGRVLVVLLSSVCLCACMRACTSAPVSVWACAVCMCVYVCVPSCPCVLHVRASCVRACVRACTAVPSPVCTGQHSIAYASPPLGTSVQSASARGHMRGTVPRPCLAACSLGAHGHVLGRVLVSGAHTGSMVLQGRVPVVPEERLVLWRWRRAQHVFGRHAPLDEGGAAVGGRTRGSAGPERAAQEGRGLPAETPDTKQGGGRGESSADIDACQRH